MDLEKAELRRALYDFVEQALAAAGIKEEHLEQITDRGDGMLILIRPHDDVPKTVLLNKLIPELASLLAGYNSSSTRTDRPLRVRAVVHAGEVNYDGKGFFGGALDLAFRLLDSPQLKKLLKEAVGSPLILVVSQEIFSGTICQGHVDKDGYKLFVSERIAGRSHRGWVHIPIPYNVAQRDESSLGKLSDEPELKYRLSPYAAAFVTFNTDDFLDASSVAYDITVVHVVEGESARPGLRCSRTGACPSSFRWPRG
jgi:hypothetical protein